MAMSCNKKVFICEIKETWKGDDSNCDVTKAVMKSSVLGVITGIQKSSRRSVFSVDDGTGSLDCVLWHNECPASMKKMDKVITELNSGNAVLNSDFDDTCQMLLNKIQINEEETIYAHGDIICCLGIVKLVKGKLLLNINHHYKADNVNAETLWILDVLSSHQLK